MQESRPAALSIAERRRMLNENAVGIVAPLFAWGTVLFLAFGLAHLVVLPAHEWRWMTPLALGTSFVFGVLYWAQRSRPVSPSQAHRAIVFGASLAVVNSTAHAIVQDAPLQVTNLMLVVIASGLLCLSGRAFAVIVTFAILGYLAAVAAARAPSTTWMHTGFALLTTTVLATVLLVHRQRTALRLELSKRDLEANQVLLYRALASAQAELALRQRVERELRELGQELEARVEYRAIQLERSRALLQTESEERRAAEFALAQQREELERARRLETVGLLAGGIAHDFNNTLTIVMACGQLAAKRAPEIESLMNELETAAIQASRLTRQLLAFGRRQLLEPKPTSLSDVIQKMEPLLERLLGEHFELRLDLDPELNLSEIDEGQLEQMFANLTLNARDAMPDGGTLSITTRNVTVVPDDGTSLEPGPYVCCSVTDTGKGMSEEIRSRIFEPFFTTKRHLGTGLGLSSVHGIIRQSHGDIHVDSELGEGTTFTIWLPVSRGAPREDVASIARPSKMPQQGSILLVEDNTAIRELLQESLRGAGFDVVSAEDGGQALALLEQTGGQVDVLISDVHMPRMSGPELYEVVAARFPDLRVLFISAYPPAQLRHHALTTTSILQKPFPPSALVEQLRTLLSQPVGETADHAKPLEHR